MRTSLLVATGNSGKIAEFADMFRDLQLDWLGLSDIKLDLDVAETGATFKENAILKASEYAAASGLLTLADDSGLEVDALDGRPGVHTARYGGVGLTTVQRYELLLEALAGLPMDKRTARFRCVIAIASPNRFIGASDGVCEGMIAERPVGSGGFGYDPVFYLPDREQTMAELSAVEKHRISHRGKAIMKIAPLLRRVLSESGITE